MPCCALAAFILGQALIGLDGIKRFFGIAASATPINPATEWRLNSIALPRKSRPRLGVRWAAVVAMLEIALVAGGVYGLRAHFEAGHDSNLAQIERCPR